MIITDEKNTVEYHVPFKFCIKCKNIDKTIYLWSGDKATRIFCENEDFCRNTEMIIKESEGNHD